MDFAADFAAAQKAVSEELVATTRTSAAIGGQDITFFRSSDPALAASIDQKSTRLLELTQRLLNRASTSKSSKSIRLPELDAIDAQWRRIVDAADTLYERADICLDEFSGLIRRNPNPAVTYDQDSNIRAKARPANNFRDTPVPKPQLQFYVKPPNDAVPPFRPLLSSKPHARTGLEKSISQELEGENAGQFKHPYADEVLAYTWPSHVLQRHKPRPSSPFDSTTATMVDTVDGLLQMLGQLKSADVIAVDLEHHDMHSFHGIVSLMQISTRDKDWIVDTLKPWRAQLSILNEVFANPAIVKVFHGAHMDVIWLQRDFGLYLVGLFDTHHASRILHYPGGSLSFLLKRFVNFDAQKQYQTADWRIRPLPREMAEYARSDTHFLLYIYDCMLNELLDANPAYLQSTGKSATDELLERSKETALQRYEYPNHTDDITSSHNQWAALLARFPTPMTSQQIAVFARIHRWRDTVAREEDEGTHHVLANHAIFALARADPLDNKAGIFAIVHNVSPILRKRSDELLSTILDAVSNASGGPDSRQVLDKFPARQRSSNMHASKEAVAVSETHNSAPIRSTNEQSIRTNRSSFWGSAIVPDQQSAIQQKQLFDLVPHSSCQAALEISPDPLPRESARLLAIAEEHQAADTSDSAEHPKKRSRGREEALDESVAGEEDSAQDLRKVERRAKRKERKARKIPKPSSPTAEKGPEGQPFDYESAAAILNVPMAAQASAPSKKPLNPYVKGENAAPGLKKTREYQGGRSHTYR